MSSESIYIEAKYPGVALSSLPEEERELELMRRLHVDMQKELKGWNEKYGWDMKYELDVPLTWFQGVVLDGIWFRIKLWLKRNMP